MSMDEVRSDDAATLQAIISSRFAVGDVLTSPSMPLDRETVDAFDRGTWLDLAYPGPEPDAYGEDLIPGFMSLSLLDALAVFATREAGLARNEDSYGLNYGLGKVRFVRRLQVGDTVSADFVIRSVAPRGEGVLVTRDCTLYVEPEHEVALVAEWLSLHLPTDRPPEGPRSVTREEH